jgi:hypothetical protein
MCHKSWQQNGQKASIKANQNKGGNGKKKRKLLKQRQ